MAFEMPGTICSFTVGTGGVTRGRAVKLSAAMTVVAVAAANDVLIGVARETVAAGGQVAVNMVGPIVKMEAGEAVVFASRVSIDTAGRAVVFATTESQIGIALDTSTASGQLQTVMLTGLTGSV